MARTADELIATLPKERQARIQHRSQQLVEKYLVHTTNMLDLYDLLDQIQAKPGLYIGTPSISNLYMFLNGYQLARRQLKLPLSAQEQEFRTFQPWLQRHFAVQTTASWAQLILAQVGDEAQAFASFFALRQSFSAESPLEQPNGQAVAPINGVR